MPDTYYGAQLSNECVPSADQYVLTDDVLWEYACKEHLENTVERPKPESATCREPRSRSRFST